MSKPRSDGYLVLAICIATAAVFATIVQSFQLIRDFDPDTTSTLAIVGGTLSQVSLAMAMLCAIIIGRHMVATGLAWRQPTPDTTAEEVTPREHRDGRRVT